MPDAPTADSPLARGLHAAIDYEVPENPDEHVPIELLRSHDRYVAAYLLVETDLEKREVIKALGLSPATIAAYCARVRQDDPDYEP